MGTKFSHEQSATDNKVDLGNCAVIGRRRLHCDVTFRWAGYPLERTLRRQHVKNNILQFRFCQNHFHCLRLLSVQHIQCIKMECTWSLTTGAIPGRSTKLVDRPLFKNLRKENLQSDTSNAYNYQDREQLAVMIKFTDFVITIKWQKTTKIIFILNLNDVPPIPQAATKCNIMLKNNTLRIHFF